MSDDASKGYSRRRPRLAESGGKYIVVGCNDGHDWVSRAEIVDERPRGGGVWVRTSEAVRTPAGADRQFETVSREWPEAARSRSRGKITYVLDCLHAGCPMKAPIRKENLPKLVDILDQRPPPEPSSDPEARPTVTLQFINMTLHALSSR